MYYKINEAIVNYFVIVKYFLKLIISFLSIINFVKPNIISFMHYNIIKYNKFFEVYNIISMYQDYLVRSAFDRTRAFGIIARIKR